MDYLGHTIALEAVLGASMRNDRICTLKHPTNTTKLRSTIGLVTCTDAMSQRLPASPADWIHCHVKERWLILVWMRNVRWQPKSWAHPQYHLLSTRCLKTADYVQSRRMSVTIKWVVCSYRPKRLRIFTPRCDLTKEAEKWKETIRRDVTKVSCKLASCSANLQLYREKSIYCLQRLPGSTLKSRFW